MFPKSGKFKYSFENGKPWQSENLYAPFNFAVLKNSTDLEGEINDIKICVLEAGGTNQHPYINCLLYTSPSPRDRG